MRTKLSIDHSRISIFSPEGLERYEASELRRISVARRQPTGKARPEQFGVTIHLVDGSKFDYWIDDLEDIPYPDTYAGAIGLAAAMWPVVKALPTEPDCCPPQGLLDLRGVGCENVFDDRYGFTEEQWPCIVGNIPFCEPLFLDALTPEQLACINTCDPVTVRTTDTLTVIATPPAGTDYDLPQTKIDYIDASGVPSTLPGIDTGTNGTEIVPDVVIPRITIYESDGVTVQGYTDIVIADYTVDACPVTPTAVLREYAAGDTWSKPAGLREVLVLCVGAGGGGGGGRNNTAAASKGGGTGGGGGAAVWRRIPTASLSGSETVTIGSGGSGGAGTAALASGGNGTKGGDTSFGSLVIAEGGHGGGGGTNGNNANANPAGGRPSACTPAFGPYALMGGHQSGEDTNFSVQVSPFTGRTGQNGMDGMHAAPGGGAGGYRTAGGSTSGTNGWPGGGVYENGILQAGPATPSANGVNDECLYLMFDTAIASTIGIGTGGAGGECGSNTGSTNGGNGGIGGRCAGGGGGGPATNLLGAVSGAGGTGGDGLCFVLEIYG